MKCIISWDEARKVVRDFIEFNNTGWMDTEGFIVEAEPIEKENCDHQLLKQKHQSGVCPECNTFVLTPKSSLEDELKPLNAIIQVCQKCGKVDVYKNDGHYCHRKEEE